MKENDIDQIFKNNIEHLEDLPSDIQWNTESGWESYQKKKFRMLRFKKFLKYAAILLPLILLAVLMTYRTFQSTDYIEISTDQERTSVTLNGLGTIFLNRYSTIRYPEKYSLFNNEIYLEGEAYFDLMSNKFLFKTKIEANKSITYSKKAALNIKASKDEERVEIYVDSGKVSVYNRNFHKYEMTCNSGEKISVPNLYDVMIREECMDPNVIAWLNGRLQYHNAPVEYVVQKVSEIYDVQLMIDEYEVRSQRVNINTSTLNLDEALEQLKDETSTDIIYKNGYYEFVTKILTF